eukprot:m.94815 g.94815  ORF g.94815 m.94815 type:complete len:428 (+) comp15005_c0_seq4:1154-2437(+)
MAGQLAEIEIVLGTSFGRFQLGMCLNDAVEAINEEYQTLTKVEVLYDVEQPNAKGVVVDLPNNGFLLRFTRDSQQLTSVEVYNAALLQLSHQTTTFASPAVMPTFEKIYHLFGVCNSEYLPKENLCQLQYNGGAFLFDLSPELQHAFRTEDSEVVVGRFLSQEVDLRLSHLILHKGKLWQSPDVPPRLDDAYFERVRAIPGEGLAFPNREGAAQKLSFGDSTQDTISVLGRPDDIYFKVKDRMSAPDDTATDFIYNYFQRGLDVCFDGTTKTLHKLILYTNVPGHFEFSRYNRCNFSLNQTVPATDPDEFFNASEDIGLEESVVGQQPQAQDDMQLVSLEEEVSLDDTLQEPDDDNVSEFTITPNTVWSKLPTRYEQKLGKPIVRSRKNTPNTTNPFPLTRLYGCNDVIFEVCHNGALAIVTLFKLP